MVPSFLKFDSRHKQIRSEHVFQGNITLTKALGFKKKKSVQTHAQPANHHPAHWGWYITTTAVHSFWSSLEVSDALEIFESMKARKVMPNHVTYSALVSSIFVLKEVIAECLLFIDRMYMSWYTTCISKFSLSFLNGYVYSFHFYIFEYWYTNYYIAMIIYMYGKYHSIYGLYLAQLIW